MDNDDMRRGKPSCHIKFGEDTALLAGDTLLTESFGVALKSTADAENKLRALDVLRERAGADGMIGGQVMDLSFEKSSPDAEALKKMYLMKTGALLSAAAEIGCILSGAHENTINIAREYAQNTGVAFQIIDDILDNIGDEKLLGKPVGSDQKNNKTTFVSKYGIEECRNIAARLTETAKEALNAFEGDKTNIIALTDYLLKRKY
jgi:geranylgeranyl diphosphate synthase type II